MIHLSKDILRRGASLALGGEAPDCPAAEASLHRLIQGNARSLEQDTNPAKLTDLIRIQTAHAGQHPYAAVVCCADSRVPPEHIFGAGIGELFVIRNAGNVMTPSALGSVEYAVAHLHVPLVLVMGHRGCGAVVSALQHAAEDGALGDLVAQVARAVGHVRDPKEAELRNLCHSMAALGTSDALRELAGRGSVGFAGAIYDIRTGSVGFLREEPQPENSGLTT